MIAKLLSLFTICALTSAFLVGCGSAVSESHQSPLDKIGKPNPLRDFESAVKKSDFRFVGWMSLGEFVPGVEERRDVISRFGVRFLEGISDTSPKKVQEEAVEYAQIYNLVLLRYIECNELDIDSSSTRPAK
jgi:hypothetical protein